jgi:hypothetical protein
MITMNKTWLKTQTWCETLVEWQENVHNNSENKGRDVACHKKVMENKLFQKNTNPMKKSIITISPATYFLFFFISREVF